MNEKNKEAFFIQHTSFEMPLVILCGGKSSRMKEDKALLSFASSTSLSHYQYSR